MAADPFASASLFHLIINAILQHLLGIKNLGPNHSWTCNTGILGCIEGNIGTFEAQGRGTLHLHMVLWLTGSIPASKMKEYLLSKQFRKHLKTYISTNIHADLPDVVGKAVLSVPKTSAVSFSHLVNSCQPNYEKKCLQAEKKLACTLQIHQSNRGCMWLCNGLWVCKQHTSFPLADEAWVNKDSLWGLQRSYGYFNNFCPALLQTVQAKHSIKLITNGDETKHIRWYITHYVAKKQKASTNTSALLADAFAFQAEQEKHTTELTLLNKQLIQHCANTLTCQQELSAPEVVSYLMGWRDHFISHHFEMIHWYAVVWMLKVIYPVLRTTLWVFLLHSFLCYSLIPIEEGFLPKLCQCHREVFMTALRWIRYRFHFLVLFK